MLVDIDLQLHFVIHSGIIEFQSNVCSPTAKQYLMFNEWISFNACLKVIQYCPPRCTCRASVLWNKLQPPTYYVLYDSHQPRLWKSNLKVGCSHCIFIPQGSTRSSKYFLCQMKAHIFLINPKISAQNLLYLRRYSWKCTYFHYINFDFLMYFHNSLIPSVTSLPPPKCKKQLSVKIVLRGQGQSVESEKTHVKMGTSPLIETALSTVWISERNWFSYYKNHCENWMILVEYETLAWLYHDDLNLFILFVKFICPDPDWKQWRNNKASWKVSTGNVTSGRQKKKKVLLPSANNPCQKLKLKKEKYGQECAHWVHVFREKTWPSGPKYCKPRDCKNLSSYKGNLENLQCWSLNWLFIQF